MKHLLARDDQPVNSVELFFDLVFIFSAAQIVVFLHDSLTWGGVGRAALLFWLVWWAWNRFTWTLNAADTSHRVHRARAESSFVRGSYG